MAYLLYEKIMSVRLYSDFIFILFLIWYLKHENGMFKNIFIHININYIYIYIYESELNSWPDSSVG